ncbi:MAG: ribulokinase [Eubacteriales bacterium]|nr:ribulokinase [Eubacteriales bacterium]
MEKYSIGIDFGTAEVRAMLADGRGNCVRQASSTYPHGVMTEYLHDGTRLPEGFALQHPADYVECLCAVLREISAGEPDKMQAVAGIGIDFTQCTMMPVDAQGEPLCFQENFCHEPYAYAKLWKHHGAEAQAEKMTLAARERKEKFLPFYGGKIYAESMFPKILETYEKALEVYRAADQFTELADWIPRWLTGTKRRSLSIAGCAALWNPETGYPSEEYFEAAAKGFGKVAKEKMTEDLVPVGEPVGYLTADKARLLGLPEGIPVAAGLGDCQAAFVGSGISQEHILLSVMGTSSCDMLVHEKGVGVPGMYGVSFGSILPDKYGYEAGQATMGDLLGWFTKTCVPGEYTEEARRRGISIFDYLNTLAEEYEPGETGLLALDWWSGNRSVLLDTDLSGMILGMNMDTKCWEIYRALAESLAFGKRMIVEQFEAFGIHIEKLYVTGGVANKNPFLMQMFSDVLGMPVGVSEAENGSCLGSAIYGMAAGKGYESLEQAAKAMGRGVEKMYLPREEKKAAYDTLYREYSTLYQYFGRENKVMKTLKALAGRGK